MIRRVPLPNCRSGVIGLAIADNPKNDGRLSLWQEAVGHEINKTAQCHFPAQVIAPSNKVGLRPHCRGAQFCASGLNPAIAAIVFWNRRYVAIPYNYPAHAV
jgi:hypothetical protein